MASCSGCWEVFWKTKEQVDSHWYMFGCNCILFKLSFLLEISGSLDETASDMT